MRYFILALLIFFTISPGTTRAGDWRVIPIKLFLGAQAKSGSIRLINNDVAPLNIQVSAVTWSQDSAGNDLYEPTDDIVFFPRVMTVPAQKEQILRAGIKFPATATEKTYRLFIEEIPEAKRTGSAAVTVAIRFALPIFVAPIEEKFSASIQSLTLENGHFSASAKNSGNIHFLPNKVTLSGIDDSGKQIFTEEMKAWYLLAGTSKTYTHQLSQEMCQNAKTIKLEIEDHNLKLSKEAPIAPENCPK